MEVEELDLVFFVLNIIFENELEDKRINDIDYLVCF